MFLLLSLFIFILIFYYIFQFVRLVGALNRPKVMPVGDEEVAVMKLAPSMSKWDGAEPTIAGQKVGLIMYAVMLVFAVLVFYVSLFTSFGDWYTMIFVVIPILQLNRFTQCFAILEDGMIVGAKFLAWSEIKGYEYARIDLNHRFYGYEKVFNEAGYEVIFHQTVFAKRAVIATDEMKERLDAILLEKLGQPAEAKK